MRLTHIRLDEIVKITDLPCYARGYATFSNGRRYRFTANFAHGYGNNAVAVYHPTTNRELPSEPAVKAILDLLGFTEIAQRERDAIAAFEFERVAACQALIPNRPAHRDPS